MSEQLSKVDSAVQGLSASPPKEKESRRRASSTVAGVMNINELGKSSRPVLSKATQTARSDTAGPLLTTIVRIEKDGVEIQVAKETQKSGW
jgi:hypothetical protein